VVSACPYAGLSSNDEGFTVDEKLRKIRLEIDCSPLPMKASNSLLRFLAQSVKPTFNSVSDVLPHRRKKAIHGAVRKVSFEAVENPYTGLFQDNWAALIRYSLAFAPSKEGIVVAAAVKIFRDNVHSSIIFVMYEKKPQTSSTFSSMTFQTILTAKKVVFWVIN
jgi:hypothetical protein